VTLFRDQRAWKSPIGRLRLGSDAMKKLLLILALVGLGFLVWRYFSEEPA
jgi:hypothetical protein